MGIKTSESSPIRVDFLDPPSLPGKIGMTFAPGKHQNGMTANWRRDLDADLLRLREEFEASVLVCLLEEHELADVEIEQLPDAAKRHGIEFWHFPIPDTGVPSDFEASADLVSRIHGALENGETVVIHCMGGLGRTGTIAAACLVGLGETSEAAIRAVRSARLGTIENRRQENFVAAFREVWQNSSAVHRERRHIRPGVRKTEEVTPSMSADRYRGCLLGLACGDAVGTTVEFKPRGSFSPITDMVGGGPFRLNPGEWTDDTSMALCLGTSLIECGGFDPVDQMERYCRWWSKGYLSSNGSCFDIGSTVSGALRRFQESGEPFSGATDPMSAGNGSIMRLAPVVMFFAPDATAVQHYAAESSRTTHGCDEAVDACRLLGAMLLQALAGAEKEEVLAVDLEPRKDGRDLSPSITAIQRGNYRKKVREEIRGTGYVVDSLEAALWCFATTYNFPEAILRATNLGEDADTTAAICGQIAGAYYGAKGIPASWIEQLALRAEICELADALREAQAS